MRSLSQRPGAFLVVNVLFFALIAVLDQSLKHWSLGLDYPREFLGLKIFPYENRGVFGGYLADLDPWIVRIFFSVLFGFVCLGGFLTIHFLKHKKAPILKWGILVYLSGLLGNVWDRMSRGSVIDYIVVEGLGEEGMAFNFADFVVVIGFFLIATAIFREADALWFDRNQRRGYWVEPRFQRSFGFLLCLTGFAHFAVIALYSFVFLQVFIGGDADLATLDSGRVIFDYLAGLFVLETSGLVLTFAVSILLSHRFAGPLLALEQYLRRLMKGGPDAPKGPLQLRRADYFQERLEAIARQVSAAKAEQDQSRTQKPVE